MGPLWDFDLGFGGYPTEWGEVANAINNPEGFHIKLVSWYNRLFQDPVFLSKVKERFGYFYLNRQSFFDHIDSEAALLIDKIVEENKLWGRLAATNAASDEVKDAYQEKVNELKDWLNTRLEWLNTALNAL